MAYCFSVIISKYILLIILSPWLAFISEKTAQVNAGQQVVFSWAQLINDEWRGVLISMRNFIYELGINLTVLLVSLFFPLITPLAFVINLYVGAYFYGFSMMDYACKRKCGICARQ